MNRLAFTKATPKDVNIFLGPPTMRSLTKAIGNILRAPGFDRNERGRVAKKKPRSDRRYTMVHRTELRFPTIDYVRPYVVFTVCEKKKKSTIYRVATHARARRWPTFGGSRGYTVSVVIVVVFFPHQSFFLSCILPVQLFKVNFYVIT